MTSKDDAWRDFIVAELIGYSDRHPEAAFHVTFPEGDSYICDESTGDEGDNGDEYEVDEDGYEDWPALDFFNIMRIVKDGPNRGRHDNGIVISRLHMPSEVTSGGRLLYSAEKGLFLDHGMVTDTPQPASD